MVLLRSNSETPFEWLYILLLWFLFSFFFGVVSVPSLEGLCLKPFRKMCKTFLVFHANGKLCKEWCQGPFRVICICVTQCTSCISFPPWGIHSALEICILRNVDVLFEVTKKEFFRSLYLKDEKKPVDMFQVMFLIFSLCESWVQALSQRSTSWDIFLNSAFHPGKIQINTFQYIQTRDLHRVRKRLYPFFIFFSRCPVCGEGCKLHW